MMVTLRNNFHNSEVRVRVVGLPVMLSVSQTRRVYRVLCGQAGCTCGGVRGVQHHEDQRIYVQGEWTTAGDTLLISAARL